MPGYAHHNQALRVASPVVVTVTWYVVTCNVYTPFCELSRDNGTFYTLPACDYLPPRCSATSSWIYACRHYLYLCHPLLAIPSSISPS